MPIFEYACRRCDHQFEELVQGGRTPVCPVCDSDDLERLISGFAVVAAGESLPCQSKGFCPGCKEGRPDGACALA
jgi:putative FmdB family regulatory protein